MPQFTDTEKLNNKMGSREDICVSMERGNRTDFLGLIQNRSGWEQEKSSSGSDGGREYWEIQV